jgi:hypothetical protein
MVPLLVAALASLIGCTSSPVYNTISGVIVHSQTPGGTSKDELSGDRLDKARNCLYQTEEISNNESKSDLLQEILLIQVKDRYGDRMFEFYTDENFKGNKGKYYRSRCMYKVIKAK